VLRGKWTKSPHFLERADMDLESGTPGDEKQSRHQVSRNGFAREPLLEQARDLRKE
jgi:hypothetical protein